MKFSLTVYKSLINNEKELLYMQKDIVHQISCKLEKLFRVSDTLVQSENDKDGLLNRYEVYIFTPREMQELIRDLALKIELKLPIAFI